MASGCVDNMDMKHAYYIIQFVSLRQAIVAITNRGVSEQLGRTGLREGMEQAFVVNLC